MYASGGWGPNERFVTAGQGGLAASLLQTNFHFQTRSRDYANHFETPCGAYANENLDRYLLRFTGDAKYGDNMERVLLNGMLAALPMQPDGRTFYYSDYHPGARKQYFPIAWPCCSGTFAQITADYPVDIYFHDDGGLYVNLFTPSRVRWRHKGSTITVEQATEFPQSDRTTFTVHTESPSRFGLDVRVPGWVAKPVSIRVNNKALNIKTHPGTFLRINRTWRAGDTVELKLPMSLHFQPVDAQTPDLAALMYGPLLLGALAKGEAHLQGDISKPEQWVQIESGNPSTFRTRNEGILFRPFYLIGDECYTTYCHLSMSQHQP
jgi:DUF1680 family protein